MIPAALYGGGLRLVEALVLAAPTILVSLFVTGVFRRLLGPQRLCELFGSAGLKSLVQSWAIGMLLPGCSLGVIPIVRALRWAGLPGGAVLAFALSQPLFDPLSVLYGLTLSRPLVVFAFAGCSLVLVVVVGAAWERLFPDAGIRGSVPSPVPAGWPRLVSILLVMLREAAGPSAGYIALGLGGTCLLSMLLPHGALSRAVNGGDPWAPWRMTWVAIPAYATPTLAMSQLGSMFQHANSAGAALQLLTLGAGLNLGLLAWVVSTFGWRRAGSWLVLLLAASLGMAYALDRPLHAWEVDPADHTHAFDVYCMPFQARDPQGPLLAWQRLRETLTPLHAAPLWALAGIVLVGAALRRIDPHQRLEQWLESREASPAASRFDLPLPAPLVGGILLAGVIALSVTACYAYYPEKQEVFEEMQILRAEALIAARQRETSRALHYLELWDAWSRRLEVGVWLRQWRLTPYQRMKSRIFRDKLELLRHELQEPAGESLEALVREVNDAYLRLRKAFDSDHARPSPGTAPPVR